MRKSRFWQAQPNHTSGSESLWDSNLSRWLSSPPLMTTFETIYRLKLLSPSCVG